MQQDRIRRVLAAKALLYPELLSGPLTWNSLTRLLSREQVLLSVRPIAHPARLVGFEGEWGVIVSSRFPARRHTYFAAHEIGHLWLHVDDADGRHARCFNFDDYSSPDPREEEAETIAAWLLGDDAVRAFLDVPASPLAVLAPPQPSLQTAVRVGQIVRGSDLHRAPRPTSPNLAPPVEPERVRVMRQRIDDLEDVDAARRLAREIRFAFDQDLRMRQLLDALRRREEELLDARAVSKSRTI